MFAGTKKCKPEHALRALRRLGDLVDVERRRVGGEQRAGLRDLVQPAEDVALDVEILEDGLDDDVRARKAAPVVGERDRLRALPGLFLSQPPLLHLIHEHAHHRLARAIDRRVVVVDDDDRNAGLRERDRDAAAHRPRPDDAGV